MIHLNQKTIQSNTKVHHLTAQKRKPPMPKLKRWDETSWRRKPSSEAKTADSENKTLRRKTPDAKTQAVRETKDAGTETETKDAGTETETMRRNPMTPKLTRWGETADAENCFIISQRLRSKTLTPKLKSSPGCLIDLDFYDWIISPHIRSGDGYRERFSKRNQATTTPISYQSNLRQDKPFDSWFIPADHQQ
jgi:hypothetical protein